MSSCVLVEVTVGTTVPPSTTLVVVLTVVVNWYPILRRYIPAAIAK